LYYCSEGQCSVDTLEFEIKNDEVTVALQLNQGSTKGTGCHRSFLNFSLVTLFSLRNCEALIETIKNININEIKESDRKHSSDV
jgi:hypothetical protein